MNRGFLLKINHFHCHKTIRLCVFKKTIIATTDYDSDTAEAFRNSGCSWVITPESVDELSKLMQEIAAKNNDELQAIGNKGFDYALEHFSKKGDLPKLVKIIEETVKNEV